MSVDRSKAPEYRIPEHISFPTPVKRNLSNGVPLYFIPTPEIDAIRIELNTDASRSGNDVKPLVSYFTLHSLMSGTKDKTAAQLDDFFDLYASEVEVSAAFEYNAISLLTTAKHFKKVLPVFRELLTEAVFPEKELDKKKIQKALSISLQREQNGAQASQLFRQQLFGEDHPFGYISREDDVANVDREDLVSYHTNSFWNNTEVFVSGNLKDEELELIAAYFETLPAISFISNPSLFGNKKRERVFEERPKSLQSSIRLGCHLIPKTHPDYHGLHIFNTILGGYFGSRLIKNIREEKGLTYGIHSSIGSMKSADYLVIMADVIKANVDEVISEVYKEILKLQIGTTDTEEIETVRNYMIGNLLSHFSSPFELIGKFKSIHHAGLDFGFYEEQLAYIREFDMAKVMEIGSRYYNPENMIEIIVG
jgi:zinc protease